MFVDCVAVIAVCMCGIDKGGLTLEVALSKWWSNASEATLDCTVTFHGLLPTSRVVSMVHVLNCFWIYVTDFTFFIVPLCNTLLTGNVFLSFDPQQSFGSTFDCAMRNLYLSPQSKIHYT